MVAGDWEVMNDCGVIQTFFLEETGIVWNHKYGDWLYNLAAVYI